MRALRWALLNQPRGSSGLRHGAKACKVVARLDGHRIIRFRSASKNTYRLNGQRFCSFGAGKVPRPVAEVVQMSEVNFQMQTDAPFWVSLSPGQLAKELNAITDLSVLDSAMASVNSAIHKAATKREILAEQIAASEARLESTQWINPALAGVEALMLLMDEVEAIQQQIETLSDLIAQIEQCDTRLRTQTRLLKERRAVTQKLQSLLQEAVSIEADITALTHAINQIETLQKEQKRCQKESQHIQQTLNSLPTCPTCQRIM